MRQIKFYLSCFLGFAVVSAASFESHAVKLEYEPAELRYTPECILKIMAKRKKVELDGAKLIPEIRYESQANLIEFQDDVEPQWNTRPSMISNVFLKGKNRIYLVDDSRYYSKLKRSIDDSLAHELVHYIQFTYQGDNLDHESSEIDAVYEQTWFRETYINAGIPAETACGR